MRESARHRLIEAAEFYLRACYQARSAARAEEFAALLKLSRPYLSRRAAALLGMPLRAFLRTRQVARAQHLLRTTPLSVEQVALASGFGTAWTFHRHFKAAVHVTPAEYREQIATRQA